MKDHCLPLDFKVPPIVGVYLPQKTGYLLHLLLCITSSLRSRQPQHNLADMAVIFLSLNHKLSPCSSPLCKTNSILDSRSKSSFSIAIGISPVKFFPLRLSCHNVEAIVVGGDFTGELVF
ncbi:hypothetical protein QL285_043917 [Trifolium repens]|nr:hypothetical protein QL285_043917 [Trifolium repens]